MGWVVLLIGITGCSEASKNRWNEFWGMETADSKPVVKSRRAGAAAPARNRTARSQPPRHAKATGQKAETTQLENNVDRYVQAMPPRGEPSYYGDDLASKIRRQEDPKRRKRLSRAADPDRTQTARNPIDVDAGDSIRSDDSAGVPPLGGGSVVRTASTETRPPSTDIPETSDQSPLQPDEEPPAAKPVESAKTAEPSLSPGTSAEDQAADAKSPSSSSGTENGTESTKGTGEGAAEPPVLTEVNVTAAPEPAQIQKKTAAANTGAKPNQAVTDAAQPGGSIAKQIEKQAELVRKDPNNIEEQYRLRMLYLINGEDEKALEPVPGVNADIQEIIQAQVRALIAARSSSGRDPATWANRQLASIEDLRRRIRAKADLLIPKVVLCTATEAFGQYTPIDPPEFPAGRKNAVVIYIEVDNFTSEKTASGMYRTLLSVRQHLLTRDGQELWSKRDENIEDLARQRRRDFFLSIGPIVIPKALAPGEYLLKVEVEDMLAGKINSKVAKFKIVP